MSKETGKTRGAIFLALVAWSFAWLRERLPHLRGTASAPKPTPRPARSGVPPLHFGAAGRKKARNTRFKARIGVVGLMAALIGVPGANAGWELISEALSNDDPPSLAAGDLSGVTTSESAASMLRFRSNLFQNRPTPSPTPSETEAPQDAAGDGSVETEPVAEAAAAPAGSITEILHAAAAEFGLDAGYLVAVASCESGLNPGAVNPAGYHGLFQFDQATWGAYGYGSIYDATAQARTAARMLAAGMASRWPNCA